MFVMKGVGKCPVLGSTFNVTFKYLLEIMSSAVTLLDPGIMIIMWKTERLES